MHDFTYHAPTSLAEALALHAGNAAKSRFLAGGTDLYLALESAGGAVEAVIDLKGVPGLSGIDALPGGGWRIGALTLMAAIEHHPELQTNFPSLTIAAAFVGGPPIRNRATLGGNLANASPAADTSTPLLALGAEVVIAAESGERTLPLRDFWKGPRANALGAGELLSAVRLTAPTPRSGNGFARLTRSAMDIAVVNAAARITVDGDGKCTDAACALGAVGPTVVEVEGLAAALKGQGGTEAALALVEEAAGAAARPITDKRASADYRKEMAGVMARRAVAAAFAMASGSQGART